MHTSDSYLLFFSLCPAWGRRAGDGSRSKASGMYAAGIEWKRGRERRRGLEDSPQPSEPGQQLEQGVALSGGAEGLPTLEDERRKPVSSRVWYV